MKRALLLVFLASCASAREAELERKVEALNARVDRLEERVATGGGRGGRRERPHPDPDAVYAVAVAGDPFVGPADALVTVVKAQDYACRFCAKAEPTMTQLIAAYPGKLRVVYKDFVVHPDDATVPAHAACAAFAQGRFAAFNDAIWTRAYGKDTSEAMMLTLARDLELDVNRFTTDMNGDACARAVRDDMKELLAVGVSGTPTFFVNGRYLAGAMPVDVFKGLVDEELEKAEARVGKDGITAANYYEKVVVEAGKPRI